MFITLCNHCMDTSETCVTLAIGPRFHGTLGFNLCYIHENEVRYAKMTYFQEWHCVCIVLTLYCIVLYCIVLHCTVLYCIVLYCTVLYCTVLYCTVLYCTGIPCIVLYCIVHCTVFTVFEECFNFVTILKWLTQ